MGQGAVKGNRRFYNLGIWEGIPRKGLDMNFLVLHRPTGYIVCKIIQQVWTDTNVKKMA